MKKQFFSLVFCCLIFSSSLYSNPFLTFSDGGFDMTICAGDTAQGSAGLIAPIIDCGEVPQGPFGEITVVPAEFAEVSNIGSDFADILFYPTETTLFIVTHSGFSCDNPTTVTTLFNVNVDDCEEEEEVEDYAAIFNQFPWLLDKIDPEDCEGVSISIYTKSVYSFILIQSPSGENLYFEDGTFYCTSIEGYSCVGVYGLAGPFDVWNCGDSEEEEEEEEPNNPEVFNEFSWLLSIINPNNCEGTSVTVYNKGIFSFIYVETVTGNTLYFEDGGFYCGDAPGYNCLDLYGLNNIESYWTCGDNEGSGGNPINTNELFNDFNWLNSIINTDNCVGTSVSVYMKGFYYFIYVESNGTGTLYFENGTFYCSDAPGYNCLDLYALYEPVSVWNCGDVIDINADYVFCPSDAPLVLPAPSFGPTGPAGSDCPPPFTTGFISISPSVNTTVSGETVIVTPLVTTTYTITRSFPGGPGSPPCPSVSVQYTVEVDLDCGVEKPAPQCTESLMPVVICQAFGENYRYEEVEVAEEDGTVQILDENCFRFMPSISAAGTKEVSVLICNEDDVCAMMIYPIKVGNCNGNLPSVSEGNPIGEIAETNVRTERPVENSESRIDNVEMEFFTMSPNPTTDRVVVQLNEQDDYQKTITVFDLKGRAVQEIDIPAYSSQTTIPIDVANLPTGVYMVYLQTPLGIDVKRLVKH